MASRPRTAASSDDDLHRHIPRDADGDPIFLILPPGVRQSYERRMKRCERGWADRQDPAALAQAAIHAHHHRQPYPTWLVEALVVVAIGSRTSDDAKRERDAAVHLKRYLTIRDYLWRVIDGRWVRRTANDTPDGEKPTWERARKYASNRLVGMPAAGGTDAMKKSYEWVRKHMKAGRSGVFFTPLPMSKKYMEHLEEVQKRSRKSRKQAASTRR
jgi:hypothetical protein